MSDLHKNLLAVSGLALIVTIAIHFFVIDPRIERNRALAGKNEREAKELKDLDIPELRLVSDFQRLDPSSLKVQRAHYAKQLVKRFQQVSSVLRRANEEFRVIYDPQSLGHRTVAQWRGEVLSLDYSTKFHAVKDKLKQRQINLWEPILGLHKEEEAKHDEYYRLIAQLHVVERLAVLAKDNGLDLSNPEWIAELMTKEGGATPPKWEGPGKPAMIRVLPPRALYTGEKDEPFADEYPVQMSLRGSMESLCRFLDGLTQGGRFLPLESIEVNVLDADKYTDSKGVPPSTTRVEARIVCSGFLVITDLEKLRNERGPDAKLKPPHRPGA